MPSRGTLELERAARRFQVAGVNGNDIFSSVMIYGLRGLAKPEATPATDFSRESETVRLMETSTG
jgi:hypothetical protein